MRGNDKGDSPALVLFSHTCTPQKQHPCRPAFGKPTILPPSYMKHKKP